MSNDRYTAPDPEDMFSDTRMSFGDHIEELRTHLWRAIQGFLVCMIASLFVGKYVVQFIKAPVEEQLERFYERANKTRADDLLTDESKNNYARPMRLPIRFDKNDLREAVGLPRLPEPVLSGLMIFAERWLVDANALHLLDREHLKDSNFAEIDIVINDPEFERNVMQIAQGTRRKQLSTLNVTEAFFVYFKVSMITGFILGSPWIFYQIWAFIAAGLHPHEKRLVNVYLPFSLTLFLMGCAVCQFLVIPKAVEALLWFNEWMGLDPDLRLSEWLSFAITMPLVFGVSFQTPLVMLFFFKIGILDVATFRKKRSIAWFVMAVFAAVITPTVDAMSMLFLWVPMGLLYELGILICVWQGRAEFESLEEREEKNELVEV